MTKAALTEEFTTLVAQQKDAHKLLQQLTARIIFLQGVAAALADTELVAEAATLPAVVTVEPTAEAAKD